MNIHSIAPLVLALFCLSSCSMAGPNTPSALPADIQHTAGLMPLSGTWLSYSHYLSGDSCCLEVKPDREDLSRGRTLELHLCGTPYSTASGKAWQKPIATISKPGTYTYKLSEQDFSQSGGPYDYSVSFTLRHKNGKVLDSQQDRLSGHIPGPGWPASYEQENRDRLKKRRSVITFAEYSLPWEPNTLARKGGGEGRQ